MFKTLKNFSVADKRVLVRCDFNVSSDKNGNILEDFKIVQTVPTIKYLISQKAKIVLMSHLDPENTGVADKKYTLDKVAERLSELIELPVAKSKDCIGSEVESQTNSLREGDILLLENLRFHKEEKENNPDFAEKLSHLGDIYVNDAFGTCHRNCASIAGVPKLLPHCAGMLLEKEIIALDKIIKNPEKPMVAIIGGIKVETKSKFINSICKTADFIILSGLIVKEVESEKIKFRCPEKILAPVGDLGAPDISKESIKIFKKQIMAAKTIVWNGPLGEFEDKKYSAGTLAIAKAIIKSKAFSVVGGGETVEFLNKKGMIDKFSWVSTGGGAMLDYLSGDKLPGLVALG